MNLENIQTIKEARPKEALDEKWYGRFEKIGAFQDFEYLAGDKDFRNKEKQMFFSEEIENPTLDYPELEKINFEEREVALLNLKREIIKNEPNETVRQVYHWKINEKLAQLRMLEAVKNGNDHRVYRYSKFLYGNPEKEIYFYTLSQIKKVVDEKLSSPDEKIRAAAQRISNELFSNLYPHTIIDSSEFKLKAVSFEDKTEYSASEIKTAFEQALANYSLDGWKIIIESKKTGEINVSQEKKEVAIPENRKLKRPALEALIAHEIGTHVLRRESGEKSKLKILGLGLDRYLPGEEGLATYQVQQLLGLENFTGLDGHLAISLASGMDGKRRRFREVFNLLKDFFLISSKKESSEALNSAQEAAWNRCVRTFRGTTCKTAGACFTRDIVYREGNIGIWNVVKNKPEEIKRFSVGKYDPANPRHIWILEQLGITDADLEALDKE